MASTAPRQRTSRVAPRRRMSRVAPDLSPSVVRMLSRPRPRWRGVSHRWAFVISLPVGVVEIVLAHGSSAKTALAFFAVGASFMFGVSALVHLRPWPVARYHRLIQLDHTAIYVCIAAQAVPVGLLVLQGPLRVTLLAVLGVGAFVGVVLEWLPFHPPKGLMNALFLTLGWFPLVLLPWIYHGTNAVNFALLVVGGALYSAGAFVVGAMRPDPWPATFGYHEIWHVCVIVAVVLHSVMAWRLAGIIG
jgi:hemolysin III